MKALAPIVAVLAAAAALAAAADASAATTLRLTERQAFQRYVDHGAKGESAGDVRVFGGPLFAASKQVGHDRIRCVVGSTCAVTLWLDGGTLVARRVVVRPPRFSAAISDGTGSYAGARGSALIVLGPTSRYTIRLTLPR